MTTTTTQLTYDQVHRLPVQPQLGRELHLCVVAVHVEADGVRRDVVVGRRQVVGPVVLHPLERHVEHTRCGANLGVLLTYAQGGGTAAKHGAGAGRAEGLWGRLAGECVCSCHQAMVVQVNKLTQENN